MRAEGSLYSPAVTTYWVPHFSRSLREVGEVRSKVATQPIISDDQ